MERINQIVRNEKYKLHLAKIAGYEKERVFCHHDTSHFLDVARIAMILNEQDAYEISKEYIYAAALLHDIGRWQQYETGEDHAKASAKLAPEILVESGFQVAEINEITEAIASHRDSEVAEQRNLKGILYRADKLSRPCYFCQAESDCNWKQGKKNLTLQV